MLILTVYGDYIPDIELNVSDNSGLPLPGGIESQFFPNRRNLVESLELLRQQSAPLAIAMTTGCFDLFHPAHYLYLFEIKLRNASALREQATGKKQDFMQFLSLGDEEIRKWLTDSRNLLIVSADHDDYIAQRKGPSRPLVSWRQRALT